MIANPNQKLQRNSEIIEADIDNEKVMMSIENGSYYGMNPVASYVWTLLETPHSLKELVEQTTQEFEVSLQECQQDIEPFLQQLIEKKMLNFL
ncbi:MAG: PqqD family peptide modification chaperone [Sulfuricurvum sp.]|uniref:PqqD family peptide modification chaperone n=1 Tax=Sulfuricurvum sp. TaxID=2025608 RepID=UPI0025DBA662|nr:PqqD family peptide modification chaperone [Sulfuricurvum sp.]MCK9372309.1 PqqD family peptide modification chaperone [Sulfuricurvum sp.]